MSGGGLECGSCQVVRDQADRISEDIVAGDSGTKLLLSRSLGRMADDLRKKSPLTERDIQDIGLLWAAKEIIRKGITNAEQS